MMPSKNWELTPRSLKYRTSRPSPTTAFWSPPALVLDGVVKTKGKVPKVEEIKGLIK